MQRGERVLIHSGTGGVGLAAVQLAVKAGAIVFATAGSAEKRELLTALGVPHVMDSRSLAFADEVLKLTGGEGVDVVLNSLSGEAIDKSLSILRPFGRFIEIGKTDIYKNRKIGMRSLRKNISVFVADLLGALRAAAGPRSFNAARRCWRGWTARSLRPLPHRVFPVARAADAFRYMAQAKHVGKLVISIEGPRGLEVQRGLRSRQPSMPRPATSSPAVSAASDWRWPTAWRGAARGTWRWSGAAPLRRRRRLRWSPCGNVASR